MESVIKLPDDCSISEITTMISTLKEDMAQSKSKGESFALTVDLEKLGSFDAATLQMLLMLKQAEKAFDFQLNFLHATEELQMQLEQVGASYLFIDITNKDS